MKLENLARIPLTLSADRDTTGQGYCPPLAPTSIAPLSRAEQPQQSNARQAER